MRLIGKQYGCLWPNGDISPTKKNILGLVVKNKVRLGNLKHTLFYFRPYSLCTFIYVFIKDKSIYCWFSFELTQDSSNEYQQHMLLLR